MFRKGLLFLGFVTAAPMAQANPLSIADITKIEPTSIADITTVDGLGYDCIDAKYLDEDIDGPAAIAFTLAGKVRMPRTCLPEPCARALSQRELSNLTGTEMSLPRFAKEWDEYYARYAEMCRKETVPFYGPAPEVYPTPYIFWTPLLTPPLVTDDLITNLAPPFGFDAPPFSGPTPGNTPTHFSNPPIGPAYDHGRNNCNANLGGASFWVIEVDPTGRTCRAGGGTAAGSTSGGPSTGGGTTTPTGGNPPPPVTPVPGPAALGLLGSGIAMFGWLTRRRRAA